MYEIWLYNALHIPVLGLLRRHNSALEDSPPNLSGPLLDPGEARSTVDAAVEICRSFEYQLRNFSAAAPVN